MWSSLSRFTAELLGLAQDGVFIGINDTIQKLDQIKELVRQIEAGGGRAIAVPADVSKEDQVKDMVARVVENYGGLDI
ncbi:Enoyl-(Acyl carrier protein) reductase [Ceratobasidium sp. AG-Ba]|nr:Enoyl-(Acyl carrier protein) reductase [Ceratobasidium sp. AG-Ba]